MKFLLTLLMLTLSLGVFAEMADTTDLGVYFHNGSQAQGQLNLNTEKTRTEIQIRQVQTTCYRQTCSGPYPYPGPRPGPYPRPYPGPGPGGYCRQMPYPCTVTQEIPVQVFDYYVQAHVKINVAGGASQNGAPAENFKVAMTGDQISMRVDSSKRFIILLRSERRNEQMNGNTKHVFMEYDLELVDLLKVTQAISTGIQDFGLEFSTANLSYSLRDSTFPLDHSLKLLKSRRMASDIILFDRLLGPAEMTTAPGTAGRTNYYVSLSQLGVDIPDRLRVVLNVGFIPQGATILNSNQLPELTATKDVLFKF